MQLPPFIIRFFTDRLRLMILFARGFSWKRPLQFNRHPHSLRIFCFSVLFLAFLSWMDAALAYDVSLYIFYGIPVAICAWFIGLTAGLWMCVAASLSLFIDDYHMMLVRGSNFHVYTNFLINLGGYLIASIAASEISFLLKRERALSARLNNSMKEVRQLRRFLPICAWCKKVRSDDGFWEIIETYIGKRTHTSFTHGICPDCSKKMQEEMVKLEKESSDSPAVVIAPVAIK